MALSNYLLLLLVFEFYVSKTQFSLKLIKTNQDIHIFATLGRSWAALGRSWGTLARSWAALGALLGRSWLLLGRSWSLLGRS